MPVGLDQYVIPGNIIYKQRGTIWHPGENTIMGRDHTIHAAVAGYVKYYRDPQRHPKRQYIGVVFNRDDKLPYPVGALRKRKLGLLATPRQEIKPVGEAVGPSGIPLTVTRHEVEVSSATMEGTAASAPPTADNKTVAAPTASAPPRNLSKPSSIIAALVDEKFRVRRVQAAKKKRLREMQEQVLRARMGTRVFRLQSDYSYRESNWEIGRLVGDPGSVPGTEKRFSRKNGFRARRRKSNVKYRNLKEGALAKDARRRQYRKLVWDKRIRMAAARAERAATGKATKPVAAKKADSASADGKVEA